MKKLFTNDRFFLATTLCGTVGFVVYLIMLYIFTGVDYTISRLPLLVEALCVLFLYISYKNHSKNVMKGLMGSLLMAILMAAINSFNKIYLPTESIFTTIYLTVAVIMFINHYLINSDHHSNSGLIKLNQVLCLIYVLNDIAWNCIWLTVDTSLLNIIFILINVVSNAGVMASIVCVESRLDAYRLDREKAGWTEEKGYPENYVHEYEKKNNK